MPPTTRSARRRGAPSTTAATAPSTSATTAPWADIEAALLGEIVAASCPPTPPEWEGVDWDKSAPCMDENWLQYVTTRRLVPSGVLTGPQQDELRSDSDDLRWRYTIAQFLCIRRVRSVCVAWRAAASYDLVSYIHIDRPLEAENIEPLISRLSRCRRLGLRAIVGFHLPIDFSQLHALHTLDLRNTDLCALPNMSSCLQLKELRISHDFDTQAGHVFVAWLCSPLPRLPTGLRVLSVETPVPVFPPCFRELRSLTTLTIFFDDEWLRDSSLPQPVLPEFLTELPIISLSLDGIDLANCAVLRKMSVQQLSIEADTYGGEVASRAPGADAARNASSLDALLAGTALSKSLRVLRIVGHELTQVPDALRHLKLSALDLHRAREIDEIPSWLSSMPLEYLNVAATEVRQLPESFEGIATLKRVYIEVDEADLDDEFFWAYSLAREQPQVVFCFYEPFSNELPATDKEYFFWPAPHWHTRVNEQRQLGCGLLYHDCSVQRDSFDQELGVHGPGITGPWHL